MPFWFRIALICLFSLVLYAVLLDEAWIRSTLQAEHDQNISAYGESAVAVNEGRARGWFDTIAIDSGFMQTTYTLFTPEKNEVDQKATVNMQRVQGLVVWWESRMRLTWTLLYQVLLRLSYLISWLPVLILLAIPFVTDGLVRRRLRRSQFHPTSPLRFYTGSWGIFLTLVGFGLLLIAPFAIPPLMVPLMLVVLTASLGLCAAHLHERV